MKAFPFFLSTVASFQHVAAEWVMTNEVTLNTENNAFGFSVALSEDLLLVGAPNESTANGMTGQVFFYERDEYNLKLVGKDNEALTGDTIGEDFGYSVDVSADSRTVVIGSPQDKKDGDGEDDENYGSVRVLYNNDGEWNQLGSTLYGRMIGDTFGRSVSISEDSEVICIGAPAEDADAEGRADIYKWNWDAEDWAYYGGITPEDGRNGDRFGYAVDIIQGHKNDEEYFIAVSAPGYSEKRGSVQLYRFAAADDSTNYKWKEMDFTRGGKADSEFGGSVSLGITYKDELIMAVGVPGGVDNKNGQVVIFKFDLEDNEGDEIGTIPGIEENDETGLSIALSQDGHRLVVASPMFEQATGAVRVFDYEEKDSTFWEVSEESILIGNEEYKEFGRSVAMIGYDIVIGSPYGGKVQTYTYTGEQRYDGGASKRKKGMSGFAKFLLVVLILGLVSLVGYYGYMYAKKKGYNLTSLAGGKEPQSISLASINANNADTNDSEMVGHAHARPSPLRPSRGKHTSLESDDLEMREMT